MNRAMLLKISGVNKHVFLPLEKISIIQQAGIIDTNITTKDGKVFTVEHPLEEVYQMAGTPISQV